MEWFGVRILGANEETARKIVLTLIVLALGFGVRSALRVVVRLGHSQATRRSIWARKSVRLAVGGLSALLVLSIWFDEPGNFAIFTGLLAGGIAFASQNALLSIAGYFVIVLGRVFDLGDRIELGGVRGDVLDISLFKTTIMEMGVPASLFPDPHHWIAARQYTGRIVTVVNAEVFRQPVFNYTANFDLLWEEIRVPVRHRTDLALAERVLLDAARGCTDDIKRQARDQLEDMRRRYLIEPGDLEPRVYLRLTDNWIELSVRFLARSHGVRELKDRIGRRILEGFRAHGVEIASETVELVGAPTLRVEAGEPGRR